MIIRSDLTSEIHNASSDQSNSVSDEFCSQLN